MPTHHLPTEALLAYAAGAASTGQELLAACHLTVCPACREVVARAEAACAHALLAPSATSPATIPPELLARLDEPEPPPEAPAPLPAADVLPSPLARRLGAFSTLRWRMFVPGIRVHVAPDLGDPGERVFLVDFRPGARLPSHGHSGVERSLVLRGGYRVGGEAFAEGDVSWREAAHEAVLVDEDGPCTTLFVNDGRLTFGLSWLDALVDRRMMR